MANQNTRTQVVEMDYGTVCRNRPLSMQTLITQISYCKTRIVRVPFISRISRRWRLREDNRF